MVKNAIPPAAPEEPEERCLGFYKKRLVISIHMVSVSREL